MSVFFPTYEQVLRSKFGGLIFNVVEYGADPTGVKDSTGAIQRAWADAAKSNGGTVVYPGQFIISEELTPPSSVPVRHIGYGWGNPPNSSGGWGAPNYGSIITQTTAGLSVFHINRQIEGITIRDLAVGFNQSSTGHGIFFDPESFLSGTSPTFEELTCAANLDLSHLLVFGTDAAHYDYWFGNVVNGSLHTLEGVGLGGFYKFFSYHPSGASAVFNFGNCTLSGYWQHLAPVGSSYNPSVGVVSYEVNNNTTVGTPQLNYIQHKGVLDIVLNQNLTSNLAESKSTGTQLGLATQLPIYCLQQNDLGVFDAPVDASLSGLFIGFQGELMNKLEWLQANNFRNEYSPVCGLAAVSGSAPATIASYSQSGYSSGVFRVGANLNVNTYTSGTVDVVVSYTSGWDSTVHTQTLCSLGADGEAGGTTEIYVAGGSVITVKTSGTFVADFHSWATIERLGN